MAEKFAPAREKDGLFPYVVTQSEFGHKTNLIFYAASLKEAKAKFGWTRQRHVSIRVRRALPEDMILPAGE
jgi:hypothetical protein